MSEEHGLTRRKQFHNDCMNYTAMSRELATKITQGIHGLFYVSASEDSWYRRDVAMEHVNHYGITLTQFDVMRFTAVK